MLSPRDRVLARLAVEKGIVGAPTLQRATDDVRAGKASDLLAALLAASAVSAETAEDLANEAARLGELTTPPLGLAEIPAGLDGTDLVGEPRAVRSASSNRATSTPAMGSAALEPGAARDSRSEQDLALARVALERALVDDAELRACFQAQADFAAIGRHLPLGQILIKRRVIDVETFVDLVRAVRSRSRTCDACGSTYLGPVSDSPPTERPPTDGEAPACPQCGSREVREDAVVPKTPVLGVRQVDPAAVAAVAAATPGRGGVANLHREDGGDDGVVPLDLEPPPAEITDPPPTGAAPAAPPELAADDAKSPSRKKKRVRHTPLSGRPLGRYIVLSEIARGGMGVVYRARDTETQRIVALKVLKAGVAASERQVRRFKRETAIVSKLHHPNIVPVFDFGFIDDQHYFTMELIHGRPLDAVIHDRPLAIARALDVAEQMARAIHHAHEQGVIHRDLKPANVLLNENDVPMITDFGLAKDIDHTSKMTKSGAAVGTPYYMPPEQAKGDRKRIDRRVDVYAIGVVLFEMLTGELPYDGDTTVEVYHKIMEEEPPSPSAIDPRIDQDLDRLVQKAMAKERADRYPTALALADDIRRRLDGKPVVARPPSSLTRAGRRLLGLAPWLGALAAAALVLISVFFLVQTVRQHQHTTQREIGAKRERERVKELARVAQSDAETKLRTAQADLQDGRSRRAAKTCREALDSLAEQRDVLQDLAFADLNAEKLRAFFDRTWKRDCGRLRRDLHITQGVAMARDGTEEGGRRALRAFAAALEIDPVSTQALVARAQFFAGRGRWTEALAAFDEALRIDEQNRDALQRRGAALEATRRYTEAIEDYRTLVELERAQYTVLNQSALGPGGKPSLLAKAMAGVARCDMALGRPEEAVRELTVLVENDQSYARWFAMRSLARLLNGDFPGALRDAQAAIDVDDRIPEGFVQLARVELARERIPETLHALKEALERAPGDPGALVLRGAALERDGDLTGARRLYRQAADEDGPAAARATASTRLGNIYLAQGLARVALGAFERALHLRPTSRAALLGRGRARLQLGDDASIEQAAADAEAARAAGAPEAAVLPVLAEVERRKGSHDAARALLEKALATQAPGPQIAALVSLGSIEYATGSAQQAGRYYRQALRQEGDALTGDPREWLGGKGNVLRALWDPSYATLRPELEALLTLRRGRYHLRSAGGRFAAAKRGRQACERANGWEPRVVDASFELARYAASQSAPDEALRHLARTIETNPGFGKARALQGQILFELERYDEALKALQDKMELGRLTPNVLLVLGRVLEKLGRLPQAERALRSAARQLAVGSTDSAGAELRATQSSKLLVEAYRGLARVLKARGRAAEAKRFEAFAAAAEQAKASKALRIAEEGLAAYRRGDLASALAKYDQAIRLAPDVARVWQLKAIAYFNRRPPDLLQASRCWAHALMLDVYYLDVLLDQMGSAGEKASAFDLGPVRQGLEAVLAITPNDEDVLFLLGTYPMVVENLRGKRMPAEVLRASLSRLDRVLAKRGEVAVARLGRAYILGALGRTKDATHDLDQAEAGDVRTYGVPYVSAVLRASWGDQQGALDALERAVQRGFSARERLRNEPRFAALRKDPRYQSIVARIPGG